MNNDNDARFVVVVLMCLVLLVACIFLGLKISDLQKQVVDLALTVEAFVTVQTDLNEYFVETGTSDVVWDMFDSVWRAIQQNTLDDAWHNCRIAHDLNILFGGNVAVDGRLNYNCINQFYLDNKPTIEEFLGE